MARIMIVEDEFIVAADLSSRVESMGHRVTRMVHTGEDAVRAAESDRPDLVLMDIMLGGGMDGIEAARRIRTSLLIPVVFVTAHADEERLSRAKLTLPFGFVLKPFQDRDIRLTIDMALYAAQADAERKRAEAELLREKDRFRAMTDESPLAVAVLDMSGEPTYINPRFRELLGWLPEDINTAGKWFDKVYPDPAYREKVRREWDEDLKNLEAGCSPPKVFEAVCADGGRRQMEWRIQKLNSGDFLLMGEDITRRLEIEAELHRSRDMYIKLINASPDAIVVTDEKGLVDFLSPRAMSMFAVKSLEEVLGRHILGWIEPRQHEQVMESIQSLIDGTYRGQKRYRLRRQDGQGFEAEINSALLTDAEGHSQGVVSIIRDITDRLEAERAILARDQSFREVLESSRTLLYRFDVGRDALDYLSAYVRELIGWEEREYLCKNAAGLLADVHPDDLPHLESLYREAAARGERRVTVNTEHRHLCKDGSYRLISNWAILSFDLDGRLAMLSGSACEPRSLPSSTPGGAQALDLKQMVQNDPSPMALVGPDGFFKEVNQALCELMGYPARELLLLTYQSVTHPEDRYVGMESIMRLLSGEDGLMRITKRYVTKGGRVFWASVTTSLVRDQSGEPSCFISRFRELEGPPGQEGRQAGQEGSGKTP